MAKKKQSVQSSPIDDLTYDVITIIHEKTKGLEAYEKYIDDAVEDDELTQTLESIRDNDRESIEELKQHLSRLLGQGDSSTDSSFDDSDDEDEEQETRSPGKSKRSA
jgi:hypothetical protein